MPGEVLQPRKRLDGEEGRGAKLCGDHGSFLVIWVGQMVLLGCPRKLVNGSEMGYNLLVNGIYWGYNPLTNHLLSSWDIQV